MALNITTVEDINNANSKIISAQEKYVTALAKVKSLVMESEAYFNSISAKDSREVILKAIDNEFTNRKNEMTAQSKFLADTSKIILESQQEIKNMMS